MKFTDCEQMDLKQQKRVKGQLFKNRDSQVNGNWAISLFGLIEDSFYTGIQHSLQYKLARL